MPHADSIPFADQATIKDEKFSRYALSMDSDSGMHKAIVFKSVLGYDTIVSLVDVPALGVKAGARGAIVEIYDKPSPALEVEFFDEDRDSVGTISMQPNEIKAASVAKSKMVA